MFYAFDALFIIISATQNLHSNLNYITTSPILHLGFNQVSVLRVVFPGN